MTTLDALVAQGREFASVTEVASILDLDERTVRRGIESGQLPAVKIGTAVRVPVRALQALAGAEPAGALDPEPAPARPAAEGTGIDERLYAVWVEIAAIAGVLRDGRAESGQNRLRLAAEGGDQVA